MRQHIEDLTQDVFVALFVDGARALRGWDPARGLDFRGFLGLLAAREVASTLRSRARSPWTEIPTDDETLARDVDPAAGPEIATMTREALRAILDRARAHLSERGLEMFELLLVEGRTIDEVCATTRLKPDAVYAWRSRLGRMASAIAREQRDGDAKDASAPPRRGAPRREGRVARRAPPVVLDAERALQTAREAHARAQAAISAARALHASATRLLQHLGAAVSAAIASVSRSRRLITTSRRASAAGAP